MELAKELLGYTVAAMVLFAMSIAALLIVFVVLLAAMIDEFLGCWKTKGAGLPVKSRRHSVWFGGSG